MSGEFDGLSGIVTGADSGIGRAVTLQLASQGAQVLAVDVRDDAAAAIAAEDVPYLTGVAISIDGGSTAV